ncbi:MAG: hypothetical protein IKM24_02945 [Clostridia bacterium]|nr:hypothetical protein [Clostridia bacterium]
MKKRVIAGFLVFALALAGLLAGCSKTGDAVTVYPVLSVDSAKAGDTVQVDVYIDQADLFCSTDFYLSYEAAYVTLVDAYAETVDDLISEVISAADEAGNAYVKYAGLTLTTLDLDKTLLMRATFTVNADAPAGEPYFGIAMGEYCKGDDPQGNTFTNIVSEVVEGGAKLTVTVG